MIRVSSRQRLVSWDAFDAKGNATESDDEYSVTPILVEAVEQPDNHDDDTAPLKRKRGARVQHPVAPTTPSVSTPSAEMKKIPSVVLSDCSSNHSLSVQIEDYTAEDGLLGLLDDAQLCIMGYLDLSSVRSLMRVNRRYNKIVKSQAAAGSLWKGICMQEWPWLQTLAGGDDEKGPQVVWKDSAHVSSRRCANPMPVDFPILTSLSAKKATKVDESIFTPVRWSTTQGQRVRQSLRSDLKTIMVTPEGKTEPVSAVQFTGVVGLSDRCIRADQPLPHPEPLYYEKPRNIFKRFNCNRIDATGTRAFWKPFVAPYVVTSKSGEEREVHLTPRLISYFEVSIFPKPEDRPTLRVQFTPDQRHEQRHPSECVAVGLAFNEFQIHSRMPGWDDRSYGYHGDDGGIFHNSGHMLRAYGPKYGIGDTVGCGIDFQQRAIFYTLNGEFLGYAFENLTVETLQRGLYPVVGIDTACPVGMNFGCDKPFAFNLKKMVRRQRDVVLEALS